jgi:hypothetical protein
MKIKEEKKKSIGTQQERITPHTPPKKVDLVVTIWKTLSKVVFYNGMSPHALLEHHEMIYLLAHATCAFYYFLYF